MLSLTEVKQVWKENIKRINKFNLYIDNPFCIKICDFCIYNSTETKIGSEIYNKYYKEYLPRFIHEFEDIISQRVADTIYFGGGTSTMMSPEILKDITSRIPYFEKIKGKTIENHPMLITDEHLYTFKELGFTFVSLGVQTLDEETLKKQNRIITPLKKLEHIMKLSSDLDLFVNMDLLVYLSKESLEKDIEIFKQDLDFVIVNFQPHSITIYPKYSGLTVEKVSKLQRTILQILRKYPNYHDYCGLKTLDLREDGLDRNYRLIRFTNEEYEKHRTYDCTGLPRGADNQNVLAIGGYKQRKPYSYIKSDDGINNKFAYYNINNNWELEFELCTAKYDPYTNIR